jgi:hypothetical protein
MGNNSRTFIFFAQKKNSGRRTAAVVKEIAPHLFRGRFKTGFLSDPPGFFLGKRPRAEGKMPDRPWQVKTWRRNLYAIPSKYSIQTEHVLTHFRNAFRQFHQDDKAPSAEHRQPCLPWRPAHPSHRTGITQMSFHGGCHQPFSIVCAANRPQTDSYRL